MADAATVNCASLQCIPTASTSITSHRWNRMTFCAGSGRKDSLRCLLSRMRPLTIHRPSRLPFHFRLPRARWRHHKRSKGDKSRNVFSASIARNPSGNLHTFAITSELTQGIGRFAVSIAAKRSRNTRTCARTREFTRAKSHSNATIVTKASLRQSRCEVTQELTRVTGPITARGAANRSLVFPVWRDTTEFTQMRNKMNWKFNKNLISLTHKLKNPDHWYKLYIKNIACLKTEI